MYFLNFDDQSAFIQVIKKLAQINTLNDDK